VPKSAFTCGKSHTGSAPPFITPGTAPQQGRVVQGDEFLAKLRAAEEADAQVMALPAKNELELEGNWWPTGQPVDQTPSFRAAVGGVVPGYGGHVPKGIYKIGETQMGRVAKGNNIQWETLNMAGHESTKVSPAFEPHVRIDNGPTLPGYSGYVPGSREKVGGSYFWTESGRRFAGKVAGESTEDNDRQNAISMGLDDFGAVGFDEGGNPLDT